MRRCKDTIKTKGDKIDSKEKCKVQICMTTKDIV